MDAERWRRIESLFEAAMQAPVSQRAELVEREAGEDRELADRVQRMLAAAESTRSPLDSPPLGSVSDVLGRGAAWERPTPTLEPGARLGPYRIERLIAAGGMGAVYLAERADGEVAQRVAIKVLRESPEIPALRSGDARRRFLLERQVLAGLDHPNITRLLDVGTAPGGEPYLVMEHVRGSAINEHCERRGLTVRQRMELFVKVCEAVQHAHQSLVIHRDLKPQNILVTDDGEPKVLDFGIARLLEPSAHAQLVVQTRTGDVLGTLVYASPEQLRADATFDTRSDVYSLGVVLYTLVAGATPHDLSGPLPETLRTIETERPPPPSRHNPAVSEDLDAVVMTAMAKDPARRYQSAGALREDLLRVVRHEPVAARSDSRWYLLRAEIRRRRTPLLIAAAVCVACVSFGVYAWRQSEAIRARSEQLAEALYAGATDRGRLLGRSGNVIAAEDVLWSEVESREAAGRDASLARWALLELYHEHPVNGRIRLPADGSSRIWGLEWATALLHARESGRLARIDAVTGETLESIDAADIVSVAVSANGERIVWLDGDGAVRSAPAGALASAEALPHRWPGARRVAISPSGGEIAVIAPGVMDILAAATRARRRVPLPDGVGARRCAFAGPGRLLVACGDGVLRAFDIAGAPAHEVWAAPVGADGRALAASHDGAYAAIDISGSSVRVLNAHTGETIGQYETPRGWIGALDFGAASDGGQLLAAFSADKALRVWSVPDGALIMESTAHAAPPTDVCFVKGGPALLSIDKSGIMRRWSPDRADRAVRAELGLGTALSMAAAPALDPPSVAVGLDGDPHRVELIDARTGRARARSAEPFPAPVAGLCPGPEPRAWIAAAYDGALRRLALEEGALRTAWTTRVPARPSDIEASPDRSRVAVACDDGSVRIFDSAHGRQVAQFSIDATRVPSVAWAPSGDVLVAATYPESDVHLIDADDGARRTLFDGDTDVGLRVVRFSEDGRHLAAAGDDALCRVWSRRPDGTWMRSALLTGHREGIFALALSPGGARLASAGRGGDVALWDLASGQQLAIFRDHDNMVFALEFMDDGRLISAGVGATVVVRDFTTLSKLAPANRPNQRTSRSPDTERPQ